MPTITHPRHHLHRRRLLLLGAGALLAGCGPLGLPVAPPTPLPPLPTLAPTPTRVPVIATPVVVATLPAAVRVALQRAQSGLAAPGRPLGAATLTVVEHDDRPTDQLAWAAVRAAYTAVYPSVSIEHEGVAWENARPTLNRWRESGELPAVGRLYSPEELATVGALIPLDELISAEERPRIDARVGPYRWDALFATGQDHQRRLYGLPYASATQAIYYDRAVFEQAGIKPAELTNWTWADFERICQELTRPDRSALAVAGVQSRFSAQWLHLTTRAHGGGLVKGRYFDNQTPAKLTLTAPETLAGMRAFAGLYRRGFMQSSAPADSERQRDALFVAGKAAMLPATTWEAAALREAVALRGGALGTLPLPLGPAGGFTTLETAVGGLFIGARQSNRLIPSLELLSFLSSEAGTRLYALVSGALPGAEALHKEEPWASEPLYSGSMIGLWYLDRAAPRWMLGAPELTLTGAVAGLIPGLMTNRLLPEEAARQWEQALLDAMERQGVRPPR